MLFSSLYSHDLSVNPWRWWRDVRRWRRGVGLRRSVRVGRWRCVRPWRRCGDWWNKGNHRTYIIKRICFSHSLLDLGIHTDCVLYSGLLTHLRILRHLRLINKSSRLLHLLICSRDVVLNLACSRLSLCLILIPVDGIQHLPAAIDAVLLALERSSGLLLPRKVVLKHPLLLVKNLNALKGILRRRVE